jgi:hypothetical protein
MSTEGELGDWRRGQIIAERLCAEILALEGFNDIAADLRTFFRAYR